MEGEKEVNKLNRHKMLPHPPDLNILNS